MKVKSKPAKTHTIVAMKRTSAAVLLEKEAAESRPNRPARRTVRKG